MRLYSVFDKKSHTFGTPFPAKSDGDAMRQVTVAMSGDSMLARFPDDYRLDFVGVFHEDSGLLESVDGHSSHFACEVYALKEVKNG